MNEFNFSIITADTDLDNSKLDVERNRWLSFNSNTKVYYTSASEINKIADHISQQSPNLLLINGVFDVPFNFKPLKFRSRIRTIISTRGMLDPNGLAQKSLKKKLFILLWKFMGVHKTCEFHATTEEEKKNIQKVLGDRTRIHVANNFPRVFHNSPLPSKTPGALQLVTIALISTMKNHLVVLQALATCKNHINYSIYGPVKDPQYWKECEQVMATLPRYIKVEYKRDLKPHQVEAALQTAHVFVLPSKSENFGHAIYEALSAGRPVITSDTTPWNNLREAQAGINVPVNSVAPLTDAIDYFAAMPADELQSWSAGANAYASTAIDIEAIKQQYIKMFSGAGS